MPVAEQSPVTTLAEFSSDGAVATEWTRGREVLADAELYWVSTTRPDGRPHVTPLLGVWFEGAMYFCTGANERKAKNLAQNSHCILTTGCNNLDGLDLVVEGEVARVSDKAELRSVADTYETKYGAHITSKAGTWFGMGDAIRNSEVPLYRVDPTVIFGFGKGRVFSQTRWAFS
jgi:general stress protein 26